MVEEFLHLTQGQRSIDQYVAKFNELLPFSGSFADTKEKRTQIFCRGLKTSLKIATTSLTSGPLETAM